MLRANVYPKIVAARLGHADVGVTLNTYSHVLPGMQREGAKAINEMLFEKPQQAASKGVN